MPSDETPPTTLETDLRRLGFNRTADDLNDLVATATRKRWSTTVMLERIVAAELEELRIPVNVNTRSGEREHGFRRT